MSGRGSVYLLYHFFRPDDVVSARLFSDLAEELTEVGFAVTAFPSIRSCHGAHVRLQRKQSWIGGKIRRVWRPNWSQHRTAGRFGNTLFMLIGWTWLAAITRRRPSEVMIVGTDPVLGVLVAITWRLFRPRSRIIHWCHDVYPDAAIADGMIASDAVWVRLIRWLVGIAYRRCDVIAELGTCMRHRLQVVSGDAVTGDTAEDAALADERSVNGSPIGQSVSQLRELDGGGRIRIDVGHLSQRGPQESHHALGSESGLESSDWWAGRYATLVPWALVEPPAVVEPDFAVREELFGSCRLGLLYSGNFGRAHHFDSLLRLAKRLRTEDIGVCFAGRGMRLESVRKSVSAADDNIRIAGFADEAHLAVRLAAADVHLVTLRPGWTGTVVPSKFFGALAAGRPVIFAGDRRSTIATWIEQFGIGWILTDQSLERVADQMMAVADDNQLLLEMRQRCFDVYHAEFSRRVQIDRWQQVLLDGKNRSVPVQRQLQSNHRSANVGEQDLADEKELAPIR